MEKYIYVVTLPQFKRTTTADSVFVESLVGIASRIMGVDSTRLYDKCRETNVKYVRWMVWEVMISIKQYSLKEAGRIFGDYDHSTIWHGLNQLPVDLEQNKYLSLMYNEILREAGVDMDLIIDMRNKRAVRKIDKESRVPQIHV